VAPAIRDDPTTQTAVERRGRDHPVAVGLVGLGGLPFAGFALRQMTEAEEFDLWNVMPSNLPAPARRSDLSSGETRARAGGRRQARSA